MRIPHHWAEAKAQARISGRVRVVRRFGWSDESLAGAERHARERADQAIVDLQAGKSVPQRERKVPYNGADGLPIREEIVSSHLEGSAVVTRNSYGALCLNVENVLFADVDFDAVGLGDTLLPIAGCATGALVSFALATGAGLDGIARLLVWVAGGVFLAWALPAARNALRRMRGGQAGLARSRLAKFLERHPDWGVRVYATPAGLRILATHRTFDPVADATEIQAFFRTLHADPNYARMCTLQRCFRARVSPKPWRIGITSHLRPRPGVWPVDPERMDVRREWIERYDRAAEGFAACRLVEGHGSSRMDPRVQEVVALHDRLSGALGGQPIA